MEGIPPHIYGGIPTGNAIYLGGVPTDVFDYGFDEFPNGNPQNSVQNVIRLIPNIWGVPGIRGNPVPPRYLELTKLIKKILNAK